MSYPTIDISFIIEQMEATGKLTEGGHIKIGKSHAFIMAGHKPLHKRRFFAREFEDANYVDGQVNFIQATGLAIICGFMGGLLIWLEKERDWKEGGFIVP